MMLILSILWILWTLPCDLVTILLSAEHQEHRMMAGQMLASCGQLRYGVAADMNQYIQLRPCTRTFAKIGVG